MVNTKLAKKAGLLEGKEVQSMPLLGMLGEAKLVRVEGRRFLVTEPERLIETALLE